MIERKFIAGTGKPKWVKIIGKPRTGG